MIGSWHSSTLTALCARGRPEDEVQTVSCFSEQIKEKILKQSECKCPTGPLRFAAVDSQRNTDFRFCPTCNRPTSSLGERLGTCGNGLKNPTALN